LILFLKLLLKDGNSGVGGLTFVINLSLFIEEDLKLFLSLVEVFIERIRKLYGGKNKYVEFWFVYLTQILPRFIPLRDLFFKYGFNLNLIGFEKSSKVLYKNAFENCLFNLKNFSKICISRGKISGTVLFYFNIPGFQKNLIYHRDVFFL
jgi:hypothetical protein